MNKSLNYMVIISGLVLLLPGTCFAEEKGQDLPFLHRYPGSSIYHYDHIRFDEANMPLGPFTDKAATQSQPVQGELVYIYYKNPMDRSPLEIMSNYQQTLQQEGFKILWQCANDACIAKGYSHQVSFYTDPIWRGAGDNFGTYFGPGGGRMSTARLDSPNGSQTWVYLWVGSHNGPYAGKTYIYAVQTKPMQTGLVTADRELLTATEMGSALAQQGRFSMHIHFDYNKATLRPDALPQIQQLAQTLRQHPNWTIGLDGHTDAVGSAEFNQRLSEDRARAVKAALVADGVPAQQIATRGLGATQPVADNSTDAGRAKNRRVEVVEAFLGKEGSLRLDDGQTLEQRAIRGLSISPLPYAPLAEDLTISWGFEPHNAQLQSVLFSGAQGKVFALALVDKLYYEGEGKTALPKDARIRLFVRDPGQLARILPGLQAWAAADALGMDVACNKPGVCEHWRQYPMPITAYRLPCPGGHWDACRLPLPKINTPVPALGRFHQ